MTDAASWHSGGMECHLTASVCQEYCTYAANTDGSSVPYLCTEVIAASLQKKLPQS